MKPNIGCRQDEDVSSFENAISQAKLFCSFIAHNWSFQNARVSIVKINDMLLVICGTQTPIIFVSGSSATYLCQTPINPRNSHYVKSICNNWRTKNCLLTLKSEPTVVFVCLPWNFTIMTSWRHHIKTVSLQLRHFCATFVLILQKLSKHSGNSVTWYFSLFLCFANFHL